MEESQKILKQYIPINCPECRASLYASVESMIPQVSVTTKLNLDNAKTAIKSRLNEITFSSKESKKEILEYIDNPETFLDFSDIESLLKNISINELNKIQEQEKEK